MYAADFTGYHVLYFIIFQTSTFPPALRYNSIYGVKQVVFKMSLSRWSALDYQQAAVFCNWSTSTSEITKTILMFVSYLVKVSFSEQIESFPTHTQGFEGLEARSEKGRLAL